VAVPELTPDTSGNPFVEVFFDPDDLDPDTYRLRMLRLSDERSWFVRGGFDVTPGVAAIDWECPFQSEAYYRAEMFAEDGVSLGFTDLASIVLDYTGTVVHQPLVPDLWAPVRILAGSAESLVRPLRGEFVEPEGATVGWWIGGGRSGLRNVPVSLLTETLDAANQMQAMLGSYLTRQVGVLCIRTSDGIRWPKTFFAQGDLTEIERNVRFHGQMIQFDAAMNESKPPAAAITTPLLSYSDMSLAFDTYTDLSAAIATYTASSRSYEYAGLAG
jgi:hypothetical protein